MYPNVRAEMARRGITALTLSEKTGIRYQTLTSKLAGNSAVTVADAKIIKRAIGTDLSIDDLFETEVIP